MMSGELAELRTDQVNNTPKGNPEMANKLIPSGPGSSQPLTPLRSVTLEFPYPLQSLEDRNFNLCV
jgi:hypothetical protein